MLSFSNILFVCFLTTAFTQAPRNSNEDTQRETYTTSWAVEITEGGEKMANRIADQNGFINRGKIKIGGPREFFYFELQSTIGTRSPFTSKSENLLTESCIGFVEQQVIRPRVSKSYVVPTDPLFDKQWNLLNTGQYGGDFIRNDLNVEPAWMQGLTGCNVTTVVVDDGMEVTHTDLWPNFVPSVSYDFVENDEDPSSNNPWHGTSCGGIIGGAKNDVCGVGIAYEVNLGGLAILGDLTDMNEARSLSYKNDIVDIYSNSWGPFDTGNIVQGPGYMTKLALEWGVIEGRDGKGSIYVWANGNGGREDDDCAADGYTQSIYTISVGAIGVDGNPSYFDEECSAKMVTAYVTNSSGQEAVATTALNGKCTESFGGTSSATPMVSGIISLVLEANSNLTWRDVQYLIVYTSNPLLTDTTNSIYNGAGLLVSRQFGFGVIDAEAMVTRARHWINVPQQQKDTIIPTTSSGEATYETSFTSILDYSGSTEYLEHVIVKMTVEVEQISDFAKRGDIRIELTSPSGTLSTLLSHRDNDGSSDGYFDWPFMSVMFWGEDPTGEWSLSVITRSPTEAIVSDVEFQFYGVSSIPESVANIPDECHSDCRRGCAQEGSEFCDACVNLRNAYTLECIDTCPLGYTERNKYCYDQSIPTEECISHLKNKDHIANTCSDAGFVGCCTGEDCKASQFISCFCDHDCHIYGDCCDDISLIGCYFNATQEIGTVMPYIDLGMTEGVSTQFVSEFGVSPPTFIKFPIGYGTESAVGVGKNGYFTFQGIRVTYSFPFNGKRNVSLVAPFFTDVNITVPLGQVSYEVHDDSTKSTEIFSQVNSLINEHKQTQFNGELLMIAKWDNIPSVYNFTFTYTFQGLIVTDFQRSFAVFTYYCGDLSYTYKATIGFVSRDGFFVNHPATSRGRPYYIACVNLPTTPWVNVIYEITSPPTIRFNSVFYSVDENDGVIEVCVELLSQGMITEQVNVTLNTADGTASASIDYTSLIDEVLVFPAGSVTGDSVCINISITDDLMFEKKEDFFVNINSDIADISGSKKAAVKIHDNDEVVYNFEEPQYTVNESDIERQICIVIYGSFLSVDLPLKVISTDINAIAREDYIAVEKVLTFKPATNKKCFYVRIIDDYIIENNEIFSLDISNASPMEGVLEGGTSTTNVTIIDDDDHCLINNGGCSHICTNTPGPHICYCPEDKHLALSEDGATCVHIQYSFTEPNYTVLENDSYLEVCISPNGNSLMDNVSLMVMSTNNNAEAGEDYIAVEESLNFRSGLLGICFYIRILTDGVDESNEDFNLTITADPSMNGVSVGEPSTVTVTIIDIFDECSVGGGGCSDVCIDTVDYYRCECPDQYYLSEDDFICIQVFDECSVDNGGCSHTCIDTVDSYRCECPPYEYMFFEGSVILYDFFLYEDGLRCMKDINECAIPDQECEQSCINTRGSYYCDCWDGYRLDSNGKTCSINCGNDSELSNTSGSFQTPGWPDHYPQVDFICEWTINVPNTSTITFTIDSSAYGINGRDLCPRDHIEFHSENLKMRKRFCGWELRDSVIVTTGAARIVFEGQRNPYRPVSRKGVKVDYTITESQDP